MPHNTDLIIGSTQYLQVIAGFFYKLTELQREKESDKTNTVFLLFLRVICYTKILCFFISINEDDYTTKYHTFNYERIDVHRIIARVTTFGGY